MANSLAPEPKPGLEPKSYLLDCPGLFLDVLREGSNLEPPVLDLTEARDGEGQGVMVRHRQAGGQRVWPRGSNQ